jgi:hypothetical protein
MRTYHFELVLGEPTTDDQDERLFDRFEGHVSSAVANGVPLLYLHLTAASMDDAVREAISGTRELGLCVQRIELDPEIFQTEAA